MKEKGAIMEKEEKIERKDANEKEKASETTKAQNGKTTDRNVVSNQNPTESLVPQIEISNLIYTIRGQQVMLDRDLAKLYGVETKRLNEQVKRNIIRFPESFRFSLSNKELTEVVAKCDHLKTLKYSPFLTYAFTEQGVAMLSTVLRSETAIQISIKIMEAFVSMRHFLLSNAQIFQRLDRMEIKQIETDRKFEILFRELEKGHIVSTEGIFYDGQVFDAYCFISDLIRKAKSTIVLIDNYVDDSVLKMLDKRIPDCRATIYTQRISPQLQLDLSKHNTQYQPIEIKEFNKAHDRFLIIDEEVYHIGASLKDLGKKWFAFSLLKDTTPEELLSKL